MKRITTVILSSVRRLLRKRSASKLCFSIDSPTRSRIVSRQLVIEGWIFPQFTYQYIHLRVKINHHTYDLNYGLQRKDVAKAFSSLPEKLTLNSGFSGEIECDGGLLELQLDTGGGYNTIWSLRIEYAPEQDFDGIYNPNLASLYANHQNLIQTNAKYFYEPEGLGVYQRGNSDPRLIAFYLPQFHPIKENDDVWGKGFTEWTNVTSDIPRFVGHLQPILPGDLGFYDLRLDSVMAEQITLAKKYGIFGFCFYYYWFSGRRILEQPLDMFLKHTEWDFNFTICWANENWTKRWDGRDNEVIVGQEYLEEDPLHFIKDVEHILLNPRYIKENNKPVLIVYRASELKNPEKYADIWRQYMRKKHGVELHLVAILSFDDRDPREFGFDIALDFAPQSAFFKNDLFKGKHFPYLDVKNKLLDINFEGNVADYRQLALTNELSTFFPFPTIKSVTPSWDNDARKNGKGYVFMNSNPDLYGDWLDSVLKTETVTSNSPLVFINAWNEWAEGAMLEPTKQYGHAVLNRTREVLSSHSTNNTFPLFGIERKPNTNLAVIVHLYYPERWSEISERLSFLKVDFDLFVTISSKDKEFKKVIQAFKQDAYVTEVPNRGRDVLPFLHLARRLDRAGYTAFLKLHSKKSLHLNNGQDWFQDLLENLLPNQKVVSEIVQSIMSNDCLIGPKSHFLSLEEYLAGDEIHLRELIESMFGTSMVMEIFQNLNKQGFFAGTMFWGTFASIRPLLQLHLMANDFEPEQGQVVATMAHAIERVLTIVVNTQKLQLFESGDEGLKLLRMDEGIKTYKYAS